MPVQSMDQIASLVSVMVGSIDLAMPEKRPPDTVTYAHLKAAEKTHAVASWFFRKNDLQVVVKRTPFLVESKQELLQYYEGLPLERRLDILVAVYATSEILGSTLALKTKNKAVKRAFDVYTLAVGVVCLWPRKFFYYVHRGFWTHYTRQAAAMAKEPDGPLLFSAEARQTAIETANKTVSWVTAERPFGSGRDSSINPRSGLRFAGVVFLFSAAAWAAHTAYNSTPEQRNGAFESGTRGWIEFQAKVWRSMQVLGSKYGLLPKPEGAEEEEEEETSASPQTLALAGGHMPALMEGAEPMMGQQDMSSPPLYSQQTMPQAYAPQQFQGQAYAPQQFQGQA